MTELDRKGQPERSECQPQRDMLFDSLLDAKVEQHHLHLSVWHADLNKSCERSESR